MNAIKKLALKREVVKTLRVNTRIKAGQDAPESKRHEPTRPKQSFHVTEGDSGGGNSGGGGGGGSGDSEGSP